MYAGELQHKHSEGRGAKTHCIISRIKYVGGALLSRYP